VPLFFVVSAWTLSLSHWRRGETGRSLRNYWLRRFFRIAPTYYVACVVAYSVLRIFNPTSAAEIDVTNTLLHLTFLHGLTPTSFNAIVPGEWSIATEFGFYALLPLILQRANSRALLLLALGASLLTITMAALLELYPRPLQTDFWLRTSLPYYGYSFAWGLSWLKGSSSVAECCRSGSSARSLPGLSF